LKNKIKIQKMTTQKKKFFIEADDFHLQKKQYSIHFEVSLFKTKSLSNNKEKIRFMRICDSFILISKVLVF